MVKLIAVFAVGGLAFAASAEEFALVKDGAAVARFEFGAMPGAKAKAAAEKDVALFNRRLGEVSGAELEIVAYGAKATKRTKGTISLSVAVERPQS